VSQIILPPERKILVPYEYQKRAVKFMLDVPRCSLFEGIGLGKTSQVLSVLDILLMCGSNFFPALVIAPLTVADSVWDREARKWTQFEGMMVYKILGDRDERLNALRRKPIADIYTINYENLPWLVETLGSKWPFKIVIADESTRLKNFRMRGQGGTRATALSQVARMTGRWINLTGTPAANGLTDLWGQLWFNDFGERLGRTYTIFFDRWFVEDPYSRRKTILPGAEAEIYAAIRDITLALRVEDCFPDLEKPQIINIEVNLPPKARELYDDMERHFWIDIGEDGIEAPTAAVKSMKLAQLSSGSVYDSTGAVHWVHNAKIQALEELVATLQEPMLVVYHFQFEIEQLLKAFPKAVLRKGAKEDDAFNAGKIDMLLVHRQSAGHGIDLAVGTRNMVKYTHTWDMELDTQVLGRIGPERQHQHGFKRKVRIFNLMGTDTVDYAMVSRVDSKLTVQEALMLARSKR
jgi:SNF2 family DNA or RNA helicase